MKKNIHKIITKALLSAMLFTASPFNGLLAQNNPEGFSPAGQNIPASPEAATLMKFEDIPVSLYTGVPDVNIPITAIKDRSLTLPVSLSYHSAGHKVVDVANWVGLGWKLNAGGMITRKVRGQADDIDKPAVVGFLEFREDFSYDQEPDDDPESVLGWLVDEDEQNMENLALSCYDAQPDEFYFSFGGFSGKFAFTWEDGALPAVSSSSDILVRSYTVASGGKEILSWEMVAPNGLVYTFSARETTTTIIPVDLYAPCNTGTSIYTTAWHLTQIEDPNLGLGMTLSYDDYEIEHDWTSYRTLTYGAPYNDAYCNTQGGGYNIAGELSSSPNSRVIINGKRISMVTTSSGDMYLDFVSTTPRTDTEGLFSVTNFTSLDAIVLHNGAGPVIRKSNLGYTTEGRLLLASVQQEGANGELVPPYEFDYYGPGFSQY